MPTKCPYYSVEIITRIDMTEGGIQRYLCKQRNRRFIPTTGTKVDEHKISICEWIAYMHIQDLTETNFKTIRICFPS